MFFGFIRALRAKRLFWFDPPPGVRPGPRPQRPVEVPAAAPPGLAQAVH
jgi:hypothetical protein